MKSPDEQFMRRALELAENGRGSVSPNPMVGCVIVNEGKIIGEGFHQQYGGPHAEVLAIQSVKNPELLSTSTVYVTLEPCAHWGKTPPCADLLVEKKVQKVIIASMDSNPLVGGKGVQILQKAGITVETGLLDQESRWLNRRFFTQQEKKRPYILLKWAQTQDGFVARSDYSSKWISNSQSRQLVHKWRAEEDAIMVGKNTALQDNPRLNVRDWSGKNPIRIVLDSKLELPSSLHIFDQTIPTLCYNSVQAEKKENLEWVKMAPGFSFSEVIEDLHSRKIQSLIVEGGTNVLQQFIKAGLWDEARVFTSKTTFGGGIPAPKLNQNPLETLSIGDNRLDFYYHG